MPGFWAASILFFATNVWILGIIVKDIGSQKSRREKKEETSHGK